MAASSDELPKLAEENPDLCVDFIAKIVEGLTESETGLIEPLDWSIQ